MSAKTRKWQTNQWMLLAIGFILGVLIILAIRFFTYDPAKRPHYHANFAVYINSQREMFKDPFIYESNGAACEADEKLTPKERVHMHDNINDVVHVHDNAVTWGNFFQSIGWNITQQYISTPTQLLPDDAAHKVNMILNGHTVDGINLLVIGDRDRLLVDYGDPSAAQLQTEYKAVPATAAKYDASKDPKSCGSRAPTTVGDRLKHLF